MKKYIKPVCEEINIATEGIMNGMSMTVIKFDPDLTGDDNIIRNSDEVLGNENPVWDRFNDNL